MPTLHVAVTVSVTESGDRPLPEQLVVSRAADMPYRRGDGADVVGASILLIASKLAPEIGFQLQQVMGKLGEK